MYKRCKVTTKKNFSASAILFFAVLTFQLHASYRTYNSAYQISDKDTTPVQSVTKKLDTIPEISKVKNSIDDSSNINEVSTKIDTTKKLITIIDTFIISKDSFNAPIDYTASDSAVLTIPTKEFVLYGKAHVAYTDITLEAGTIKVDSTQTIVAYGGMDTTNNPLDLPTLVQRDITTKSDTIFYNFKSQKGLTKSTYLQQGEIFVYSKKTKQIEPGTFFAQDSRFTTCNLDTPHFAIRAKRMKFINKKLAVSGFAQPEFEGVPIPAGLPFGIYPLNRGRRGGFIMPSFASNQSAGLALQGGGYYLILGEHWDITTRADLYSYGGWKVNFNPRYTKRYKYQGNFNLGIQNTVVLNEGGTFKDEFSKTKTFNINWNHSRDSRARPGTNFTAYVNAGSTQYNINQANNPYANFNNNLSSSITWSKNTDKYALTVSATHNQNSNNRSVDVSLPNISYNLLTLYPFQKKDDVGTQKWYQKLGIGYTAQLRNQIFFYDTAVNVKKLLDTAQWSVDHNVPITLSLPQLGPITVAPSISYSERWVGQRQLLTWDSDSAIVRRKQERGFYTPRQVSFGLSTSTRIFGTKYFKGGGNLQAIRHEIRPTIGFAYAPTLVKQYFQNIQVDTFGNFMQLPQLEGGAFSHITTGAINFGVDNSVEIKVRDKKDTSAAASKRIRILDNIGFSGNYNFLADSFKLSNININMRSTLFEKISITGNANLDPYQTNSTGKRLDKYAWTGSKFSLGRVTNASLAISSSFQSKAKDERSDEERLPDDNYITPEEQQRMLEYVRQNPAEFTDFNIPWTLQTSLSVQYNNGFDPLTYRRRKTTTVSVNVSGDFSLSPKWKIGGSTMYNIGDGQIPTMTAFITRDMHCWQLAINVTPVGPWRSFSITLNPKSGILRDLRINRARTYYELQ